MAKEALRWQSRPILAKDHSFDLDRAAAIHEFKNKMPRHEAEEKAYGDYKRARSVDAAAHHLSGMKAAHAVGNKKDAIKHSIAYGLHMKAIGYEPVGEPPDEVKAKMEDQSGVYKFKAHDSDTLFEPEEAEESSVKKSEDLNKADFKFNGGEAKTSHGTYHVSPADAPSNVPASDKGLDWHSVHYTPNNGAKQHLVTVHSKDKAKRVVSAHNNEQKLR